MKELETKLEPRRQNCILEDSGHLSQASKIDRRKEPTQNFGPLDEYQPQFTASTDYKITNSNKQFQWLSGYSRREVLGIRVNSLCPNIEASLSEMLIFPATGETCSRRLQQKSVMKYHVIFLFLEVTWAFDEQNQTKRFLFTVLPTSSLVDAAEVHASNNLL